MKNLIKTYFFSFTILFSVGNVFGISGDRIADIQPLLAKAITAPAPEMNTIISKLKTFPYSEWTNNHKKQLEALIIDERPHVDKLIMLAGFLQMNDVLESIRFKYKKGSAKKRALNLALCRTGDQAKIQNLLKNVKKIPIGDEFVFEIGPLLVYTRQKETMNYMLDIIMSDEKRCSPADAETSGNIICAYRFLEMIAPAIQDFPLEVGVSGDLTTRDYTKALETARDWILKNRSSYTLNTELY